MDSPPIKSKLISAVTSAKAGTKGQIQRLQLLEILKKEFPTEIDHFGRGVCEIKNKWDAIGPYRYHLTLENGQWPHYWSEKICDPLLGYSVPLYIGDPKIYNYFPQNSLVVLNPNKPEECIQKIRILLENNRYEDFIKPMAIARKKILSEYNFYATIAEICDNIPAQKKQSIRLKPHKMFSYSLNYRIRAKFSKLTGINNFYQ